MMKLKLLIMTMDLLTLLAYPFVFVHGILRQSPKSNENITLQNLLIADSVTSDG